MRSMKSLLSLAAGLLCVSMALAQSSTTQVIKVTSVIGDKVVLQNETVGKVTDVVLSDGGCIEYVVVSYGEQFVAIPWQAVRVDTTQSVLNVQNTQVTMANLRQLAFAGNSWPNFTSSAWTQRMQSVWGAQALRSGSGASAQSGTTGQSGAAARSNQSGTTNDRSGTNSQTGSSSNRSSNAQSNPNQSGNNSSSNTQAGSSNRSSNTPSGPNQGNSQGARSSNYPNAPDISKLKPYNPAGQSTAPSGSDNSNRNRQPNSSGSTLPQGQTSGTSSGNSNSNAQPPRRDPNSPDK